jgi:hypothetical protein
MIYCKICGKSFGNYRGLVNHLRVHKITSKEYYDKFLRKEGEGVCSACGRETSFINLRKGYCKFCSTDCANKRKYFSEEARRKISNANKGKHLSEETRKKMSDAKKGENHPNYGKHPSEETRKKLSNAKKGKHPSEETKKKMSEAHKGEKNHNYGKHRSEETRKKISDAHKGNHLSEETKKKISDAQKGKHHSEETKKKMSDARKGENNPNYKDGVSMKQFEEAYGLTKSEWKKLAQEIRKRDNFTCQLCGKKGATSVHHIIPRRVRIDNSPENLITLCISCHSKVEHLTDKYLAEGKDPREIFMKNGVNNGSSIKEK